MREGLVRTSKFLSLVLRHKPQEIGLKLDLAGWVPVADLLRAADSHGFPLTMDQLLEVVRTNDKQRFSLSDDGLKIRANQGHSVEIDLGYEPAIPPPVLYHGTVEKVLHTIMQQGLLKGQRHHVHLSADSKTAESVGSRRGRPTVLEVNSALMSAHGYIFFRSKNGVWLTEHVPPSYLTVRTHPDES
jgi:putative RNA 2'-phosphotransferase